MSVGHDREQKQNCLGCDSDKPKESRIRWIIITLYGRKPGTFSTVSLHAIARLPSGLYILLLFFSLFASYY